MTDLRSPTAQGGAINPPTRYVRGEDVDGLATYAEVVASQAAAAASSVADITRAAALGLIDGYKVVDKFGRNGEIDTGTSPEDVWLAGGLYTGFVAAAETVDVVSSSTADDAGGTGALTVRVLGLDASGAEVSEDFTLDGQTGVEGAQSFLRVNRAYVLTAGSSGSNVGIITIDGHTSGAVFGTIGAAYGQTLIACYTIPTGYTAYLMALHAGLARASGAAGSATFALQTREDGGAWRSREVHELQTGAMLDRALMGNTVLSALTDIRCRIVDVSDSDTLITAQFSLLMAEAA